MFQQAVVRLTLWYAAVIMILSLSFSLTLYNVSTKELSDLQRRQEAFIQSTSQSLLPPGFKELSQERLEQINESKQHIALNLIYFNILILLAGTAVAYFLAKRTLHPLEESMDAQNRFTADASHELRTPLTAMKTELEVALRDKSLTLAQSKELHTSTLQEIDNLESLTNGLLKLSKQDTAAPSFKPVAIRKVVGDAVSRVYKVAGQRFIAIATDVQEAAVLGDDWSLTELFTILLDNAIKYSPVGSSIEITAQKDRHRLTVSVEDHGSGIKSSDIPFLFNRFYRSDASRSKENVQGYGLGLSIAKKIVESHNGSIEIRSTVGKGSTFSVSFPLAA